MRLKIDHWLRFRQSPLPSPRCLICAWARAEIYSVCRACLAELPWLERCCDQCALPLHAANSTCGACLSHPPSFDRAVAIWHYLPPVVGMIYALKFKGRQELARLFGELLAAKLSTATSLPDCLVPVPLHPSRYRTRGFNQALEIARPIAKQLNIPLCPILVHRLRPTLPQRLLDAQTRRQNLRGVFQATSNLSGCRIAIVDDVLTTGATADELAAVLKRAGATQVEVWVLARA